MGKLTNLRSRVSAPKPRLTLPPKMAEAFYTSPSWRRLVARVKGERGNWCQLCGSKDRVIADHIVERRDGGADLDPANIQLLCFTHHQRKTAEARGKRARGQT